MAEHSAVNRRVVGSSPTSGAILINQLGRLPTKASSDTGENTGDSPSKGVLLMLSIAPLSSFRVKCPQCAAMRTIVAALRLIWSDAHCCDRQ